MSENENDRPMGSPAEGEDVPVSGITSEEREDFQYARSVEDPSDPTKGDEPGYIRRHTEK